MHGIKLYFQFELSGCIHVKLIDFEKYVPPRLARKQRDRARGLLNRLEPCLPPSSLLLSYY